MPTPSPVLLHLVLAALLAALLTLVTRQWVLTSAASSSSPCPHRTGQCVRPPRVLALTETSHAITLPLSYHQGVFEADLWLGDQPLKAVFDTGSERLIVAGSSCVAHDSCSGASGAYHVADDADKLRESTITYGTQTDSVHWYREQLRLPAAEMPPLDDLCHWQPSATRAATAHALEVGVVQQRHGDTNLNVLGFCPPAPGSTVTPACVLHAVLGRERVVFGLLLRDTQGWLLLGPSPLVRRCVDRGQQLFSVPLVRSPRQYKYYMIALRGITIAPHAAGDLHSCSPRVCPRYIIIDTGSNMMSVSTKLLRELTQHGIPGGTLELQLDNGGTLSYAPRDYLMGQQMLIRDNLPFSSDEQDEVLLLGSLFLRHRYVEIDCTEQQVRFAPLLRHTHGPVSTPPPAPIQRANNKKLRQGKN